MAKQPFTPEGVTAKQTELYALSDSLLQAQANQVKTDFVNWMKDNFTFSDAQTTSLNGLDARFSEYISFQLYFAIYNRLPVHIDKHGTESSGKLIHHCGSVSCDFGPSGFVASGTLNIDITYS